jgi:hypothetical protein
MPQKIYDIHPIEITSTLAATLSRTWDRVQGFTGDQILDALTRDPQFTEYSAMAERLACLKVPEALELVQYLLDTTDQSLVVVSVHRSPIEQICSALRCSMIIGGVRDPGKQVEDFQLGRTRVIGLTVAAASESVTLSRAYRMIHLNRSYEAGENIQVEGRLRAHLQTRSCQFTTLQFNHPLEHRLEQIVRHKMELIQGVVNPIAKARGRKLSAVERIRNTLDWIQCRVLAQSLSVTDKPNNDTVCSDVEFLLSLALDPFTGEQISRIYRKTVSHQALTDSELEFIHQTMAEIPG